MLKGVFQKMVFADLLFIFLFLPACILFYFIMPNLKCKNCVLIVFSLIFYAWGEQWYILLLLFSSLLNYAAGMALDKYKNTKQGKTVLIISLLTNLGTLAFFKYTGFFIENLDLLPFVDIPVPEIHMPIGISFFTFQNISYTLDCWWDKTPSQRSYFKYLLYISMFPQLVAGPIVRYSDIAAKIEDRHTSAEDYSEGFTRIIIGVAKKVIIANNLHLAVKACFGDAADGYAASEHLTVLGAWYGGVLVALWYYFDFSGYSDMAIGMGRIFGFHFDENFKYPYVCTSITEFWRRWHISLSSWFRDYVYIPLGGNRRGKARQCINIMIVWSLTGFWHGASWNFMLWGAYYGVLLLIEKLFIGKILERSFGFIQHLYSVALIAVGWGIFYFESLPSLGKFFKALFGVGTTLSTPIMNRVFMQYIFLFAAAIILTLPLGKKLAELAEKSSEGTYALQMSKIVCNAALLVISGILLLNNTNNPFLYFRF